MNIDGFAPKKNEIFEILAASNGVSGFFANAEPLDIEKYQNEGMGNLIADGYDFAVRYYWNDSYENDANCGTGFTGCVILQEIATEPVPEPDSLLVVGSGLFCLGVLLRKRLENTAQRQVPHPPRLGPFADDGPGRRRRGERRR